MVRRAADKIDTAPVPVAEPAEPLHTLTERAHLFFRCILSGNFPLPPRSEDPESAARARIDAIVAQEIARQAVADPAFLDRTKARLFGDILHKQGNIEAILAAAADTIDAEDDGALCTRIEPDPDWINSFTGQAERAASQGLRRRLADLLVAEIREPGSFSRATIRIVAEMDSGILAQFQTLMVWRVGDAVPTDPDWSSGEMFAIGSVLEDAALISGIHGFTHKILKLDGDGHGFFGGESHALVIKGQPGRETQIPVWLLTKIGREVARLVARPTAPEALRRAALLLDKTEIRSIHMGRILNAGESVAHDEKLWPAPAAFSLSITHGWGVKPV